MISKPRTESLEILLETVRSVISHRRQIGGTSSKSGGILKSAKLWLDIVYRMGKRIAAGYHPFIQLGVTVQVCRNPCYKSKLAV